MVDRIDYENNFQDKGFNIIILIESNNVQIHSKRPVLTALVEKSDSLNLKVKPQEIIHELFDNGTK